MSLFDQYAHTYNEGHAKAVKSTGFDPAYFHEYKIRELCNHLKSERLADRDISFLNVGCGIGESDPFIKSYLPNSRVYGIDVSAESIDVARETRKDLAGVTYQAYDGENIPFDINFDVIFIANVFHHIRHEKHPAMLRTLHHRLNDKGSMFLFELNPLNPLTLWIAYQNDYKFDKDSKLLNPCYTGRLLSASGFRQRSVRYTIFFPKYLSFLMPLEKYLHRIPLGAHYYYVARK
jgi:2-polyprenyl-3-methyl-5-hydroxy-6-metoxy-1,4-benzoquinol methylase